MTIISPHITASYVNIRPFELSILTEEKITYFAEALLREIGEQFKFKDEKIKSDVRGGLINTFEQFHTEQETDNSMAYTICTTAGSLYVMLQICEGVLIVFACLYKGVQATCDKRIVSAML